MKTAQIIYKSLKKHAFSLLVIAACSLWSIWPLTHPGLHTSHDIWHQVARIARFSEALDEGVILPQWNAHMAKGYGYPLFIFSYHLPWLLTYPLLLVGVSQVAAIKIVFGFFFALSGFSMYLFGNYLFKKQLPALVVALLYLIAPYHYLTLYVAAAIGSVIVYGVFPFLLLGLHLIFDKKYWAGCLVTALTVSSIVLSHLMSLVLLVPVVGIYVLGLLIWKNQQWLTKVKVLALAAVITLGLTAYYLVPLVTYLPHTQAQRDGGGFKDLYRSFFISPKQLIYSPWGFGPIVENAKDEEISLQLGLAQWAGVALSIAVLVLLVLRTKLSARLTRYLPFTNNVPPALWRITLISAGVTMFLLFESSAPFWRLFSEVTSVDYPFRLLLPLVAFVSLLAGFALHSITARPIQVIAAAGLIVLAVYANRNHVRVNMYWTEDVTGFVESEITTNTFNEYLPISANGQFLKEPAQEYLFNQPVTVLSDTSQGFSVELTASEAGTLTVRQFDFPGVTALLNDQKVDHTVDRQGRIQVAIPETGEHKLEVKFVPTTLSRLSLLVSALTCVIVLGYGVRKHL